MYLTIYLNGEVVEQLVVEVQSLPQVVSSLYVQYGADMILAISMEYSHDPVYQLCE